MSLNLNYVQNQLWFGPRQPYACWSAASVDLPRVLDVLHARQPQSRRRRRIKVASECFVQCRRWCRPANNGHRASSRYEAISLEESRLYEGVAILEVNKAERSSKLNCHTTGTFP